MKCVCWNRISREITTFAINFNEATLCYVQNVNRFGKWEQVVRNKQGNFKFSITVTSWWDWWRLKSPASLLFTQPFVQVQIKENIKSPRHRSLWGKFTGDRWIPAQRASNAETVSIWWRHQGKFLCLRLFETYDRVELVLANDQVDRPATLKQQRKTTYLIKGTWALRRLISPATQKFVQDLFKTNSHENTKAVYYRSCLLWTHRLNIKTVFPRYGDSHVKDKTVARPSYL